MTLLMVAMMSFGGISTSTVKADDSLEWEKVKNLSDVADTGKLVAITMALSNGAGATYALPTAKKSDGNPTAVSVTKTPEGDLVIGGTEAEYGWNIKTVDGGYTISSNDGNYLYLIINKKRGQKPRFLSAL